MIVLWGWTIVRVSELEALRVATTKLRDDTQRLRAALDAQRTPKP